MAGAIRLCHPTEHTSIFPKEIKVNTEAPEEQDNSSRNVQKKLSGGLPCQLIWHNKRRSLQTAEMLKNKTLCLLKACSAMQDTKI